MDITERKRAEKALMKIDSKTKAMLEALEYQVTTTTSCLEAY
jgi:hypothetical protein